MRDHGSDGLFKVGINPTNLVGGYPTNPVLGFEVVNMTNSHQAELTLPARLRFHSEQTESYLQSYLRGSNEANSKLHAKLT